MTSAFNIVSLFSIFVFISALFILVYNFLFELGILGSNNILSSIKLKLKFKKQKNLFLNLLIIVIVSRFALYFIAYLGNMLFENSETGFFESFRGLWLRWDANAYIRIADGWYSNEGDNKFLMVFFPLYPIVIKIFSLFFYDTFLSGIIVSILSTSVACYYLYKLAIIDSNKYVALSSVKYLLIFPVSFFLADSFSESFFLMLSIMSIYYCIKNKWLLSGLLGFCSAMTRSLGLLIIVPLIIELLLNSNILEILKNKDYIRFKPIIYKAFSILLIPFGTIVYLLINYNVTGDYFAFIHLQKSNWSQSFGLFYQNIDLIINNASTWSPSEVASLWLPQIIIIVFALFLLIYGLGKIRLSYMFYFFVYLFVCISPTWLLSAPRYIMSIFPIYLLMGNISKNKTLDFILTFIFTIFLCYCTLAFTSGKYIM